MALVTALHLVTGVPSAPITVVDVNNGNEPIANSEITWIFDTSGLAGNLMITPTGPNAFTFQASTPIVGNSLVHAVDSLGGSVVVGPPLTLTITSPRALGYSV